MLRQLNNGEEGHLEFVEMFLELLKEIKKRGDIDKIILETEEFIEKHKK